MNTQGSNSRTNWLIVIRWFWVTVLFSVGILQMTVGGHLIQYAIFLGVFIGIIIINLWYQYRLDLSKKWLVYFQLFLDVAFSTLIVHLTGGLSSCFVWVYAIGIITVALMIPDEGAAIGGLACSLALLFLIILYRTQVIDAISVSHIEETGSLVYIMSYTGLFFGIGYLASMITNQAKLHNQAREYQHSLEEEISCLKSKLDDDNEFQEQLRSLIDTASGIAHLNHDINTPLCVITLSLSRVKKIGMESGSEALLKSNNEITEAVNRISDLLGRLEDLKRNPLLDYKRGE